MASIPETWTQLKSSQTMPYKEFFEMLSCVVCHDDKCKELDLLRCGHVVCVQKCKKSLEVEEGDYFGETQFGCTKCMIKTSEIDVLPMCNYVGELILLRKKFDEEWAEVGGLRIFCDRCKCHHCKENAEEFRDSIEVCTDCRPPQIFCRMTCARKHAQLNEGHEPNAFDPDYHEWHYRYLYISGSMSMTRQWKKSRAICKAAAAATDATDAGPDPNQEMTSQLLADIDATLALFLEEETIRRETLRQLEQLPVDEQPRLLSTIALEKKMYDVLVRIARHHTILKALVHLRPQKLDRLKRAQMRLSLSRLQKLLFSVSYVKINSSSWAYVVPAYQLVHHPSQKHLAEVVSNKVGFSIPDGLTYVGLVIRSLKQKQSRRGSVFSRKHVLCAYIACPGIMVPDALKILEIAENLYIVSRPCEITLIRVDEDDEWIREQFSPVQSGYAFGRGLCWNQRSLFATVVGTNYIFRWTFQENSFIVDMRKIPAIRIASEGRNCNLETFTTDDTIAVVNGKLYICYDRSDPDRKLSLDYGSILVCELVNIDSYFVLKTTKEFKQVSLVQPRLLGIWGKRVNFVLIDARDQTPIVYCLPVDGDSQTYAFKIEFTFRKEATLQDVWLQSGGYMCMSVKTKSGRVVNVKMKRE